MLSSLARRSLALVIALALTLPAFAGPRADRKAQAVADSGRPVAVKGGERFTMNTGYDQAFDAVVRALKLADEDVVVADREAGFIASELTITGGYRQTGTRVVITLIKDSDTATIVKVAVTSQKRYKALQVEPWSTPELASDLTGPMVEKIRANLPSS